MPSFGPARRLHNRAAGRFDGTIVAAGTSTPEFAVSLVAIRRGSLGVMGLAALVRPLAVSPTAPSTLSWLTVVPLLVVTALWTGRRLSRAEGGPFAGSELAGWALGLLGSL